MAISVWLEQVDVPLYSPRPRFFQFLGENYPFAVGAQVDHTVDRHDPFAILILQSLDLGL